MRFVRTEHFKRSYKKAPLNIQKRFKKALFLLAQDIRHPSLRAKIVDPEKRIWQARVNGGWRFYFQIREGACYLLDIIPHPK
jgi:mRNA-degrading endonuclease RelE of RelBE toxin-antitoxin system